MPPFAFEFQPDADVAVNGAVKFSEENSAIAQPVCSSASPSSTEASYTCTKNGHCAVRRFSRLDRLAALFLSDTGQPRSLAFIPSSSKRTTPRLGLAVTFSSPQPQGSVLAMGRMPMRFRHARCLTTAYCFNEHPLAWECVVCGKLFAISLDEAEHATDLLPPRYIESEFNVHSCELELEKRLPTPIDDPQRPSYAFREELFLRKA